MKHKGAARAGEGATIFGAGDSAEALVGERSSDGDWIGTAAEELLEAYLPAKALLTPAAVPMSYEDVATRAVADSSFGPG